MSHSLELSCTWLLLCISTSFWVLAAPKRKKDRNQSKKKVKKSMLQGVAELLHVNQLWGVSKIWHEPNIGIVCKNLIVRRKGDKKKFAACFTQLNFFAKMQPFNFNCFIKPFPIWLGFDRSFFSKWCPSSICQHRAPNKTNVDKEHQYFPIFSPI